MDREAETYGVYLFYRYIFDYRERKPGKTPAVEPGQIFKILVNTR